MDSIPRRWKHRYGPDIESRPPYQTHPLLDQVRKRCQASDSLARSWNSWQWAQWMRGTHRSIESPWHIREHREEQVELFSLHLVFRSCNGGHSVRCQSVPDRLVEPYHRRRYPLTEIEHGMNVVCNHWCTKYWIRDILVSKIREESVQSCSAIESGKYQALKETFCRPETCTDCGGVRDMTGCTNTCRKILVGNYSVW